MGVVTLLPGITVVVPVHPPRFHTTLERALRSVWEQTRAPDALVIQVDKEHAGAADTRNRGLDRVGTEWVAFLDSDDQLRRQHLAALERHQRETGADLVYPWFDVQVSGGPGPAMWPDREGQPFSADVLKVQNNIPVTVLARTELIRSVGGFQAKGPPDNPCDDWGCWEAMVAAGAVFSHLPERTWIWHWGTANTSGRGNAW